MYVILSARCQTYQTAYHVVLKAEDAVVNIKLSQFFLMDADLVLLLDLNYSGLHLLPCGIRKFWLKKNKRYIQIRHNYTSCVDKVKKRKEKSLTHHGHLERVDVEGPDLPVAADVVDEFDEAV